MVLLGISSTDDIYLIKSCFWAQAFFQLESTDSFETTGAPGEETINMPVESYPYENVVEVIIILDPDQAEPVTINSITVKGCAKPSTLTSTSTSTSTTSFEHLCTYGNTTRIGKLRRRLNISEATSAPQTYDLFTEVFPRSSSVYIVFERKIMLLENSVQIFVLRRRTQSYIMKINENKNTKRKILIQPQTYVFRLILYVLSKI